MIWLSLDRWSGAANRFFLMKRFYIRGYKWTPFIFVLPRFKRKF